MTLATGTAVPNGTMTTQEDIYIEGGPTVYFQPIADINGGSCPEANNPDSDGFYYGLSGTALCPIVAIGCYDNFQLLDNRTKNMITCQALGVVDEMEKRDNLQITFTLKSLLPFSAWAKMLAASAVTNNATEHTEKFGVGDITSTFYHVYFARIYEVASGDYVSFTGHKAKFTNASPLSTPYGDAWNIPIEMTVFADRTKPAAQRFATWLRLDPSVV